MRWVEKMGDKKITIGILAHVDAGKTTLSEALLYSNGALRRLGRVDHKDSLFDNFEEERKRGITIFSKRADFKVNNTSVTILDTPGHVDFAAETERALRVLDYCILIISGTDGIQGHTLTLWRLLLRYDIPVFIFVNKMDHPGSDRGRIIDDIRKKFGSNAVCLEKSVRHDDKTLEDIAVCDEALLDKFLEGEEPADEDIAGLIAKRKLFPVFFGSALKLTGIDELSEALDIYTCSPHYKDTFSARVYKVSRDEQQMRVTHIKITGGHLRTRDAICIKNADETTRVEKVNQIRIYRGGRYETAGEAECGDICAITGLTDTFAGQGLGDEENAPGQLISPVINYRMILPYGTDALQVYPRVRLVCEEELELKAVWNESNASIEICLMGEVQTEIVKDIIQKRLSLNVEFDRGLIVYKETIKSPVEGVGHYEPLKHYAEVHLLMEPLPLGSGLVFESAVSEDVLDRNWQRLILTHLSEKAHKGVLTGSYITDMKLTLVNGRAHIKHTEGGDFRNATYRAVRHGLMQAESVLLEPFYSFVITLPADNVGRALTDLDNMKAEFDAPLINDGEAVIKGRASVAGLNGYERVMREYTRGMGSITLNYDGYSECINAEKVIESIGYNAEGDTDNTADSIFCSHGAGFVVNWRDVCDYMHLPGYLPKKNETETIKEQADAGAYSSGVHKRYDSISYSDDKELQDIFRRTYGEKKTGNKQPTVYGKQKESEYKPVKREDEYLLVDGYNVIHANKELEELLNINLDASRNILMDVLCNYQGFKNYRIILVFDAYRVKGNPGETVRYNNIDVIYTKEAETADRYIERTAHEMGNKYNVTVVTSDGVEQVIIRGAGCRLMSSREFWRDILLTDRNISEQIENRKSRIRNYLFEGVDEKTKAEIERIRRDGKA